MRFPLGKLQSKVQYNFRSQSKQNHAWKLTLLLVFLPTVVHANAGSPMMWFGFLHLLILNAVIGIVESMIFSRHKIEHRTLMIILGNYVSMFIGLEFIAPYFSTLAGNHDFWGGRTNYGAYELNGFLAGMGTAFIATLIIEFPFFYYSVKDKDKRKEIINPYLMANLSTNLVLFIIYSMIVTPGSAS